jgi:hypothetical protein
MNVRTGRRSFSIGAATTAAALMTLATACRRTPERPRVPTVPTGDEPLWRNSSGPDPDDERARVFGKRAMAGLAARPSAPTGLLSVRRTTALEYPHAELLVGSQGTVACSSGGDELIGPLGMSHGLLGATAFCLDRSGAHVIATRRSRWVGDRARLLSYRMPEGTVVGHFWIDEPRDVVEIHRFDSLYLICSAHPRPLHTNSKPETAALLVDAPSLGAPGVAGKLIGVRGLAASRSYEAGTVLAGASASGIVLATDLGVQWTDWALRPNACWRVRCWPQALAVGRSGEAALVCDIARAMALVAFDAEGKKRFRVPLPESRGAHNRHAIVDDDGRIILSPPGWLIAFERDGSRRWILQREGVTPAVLLAGGHVMFEHESGLWIADRHGVPREVWKGSAPLSAGPVEHDGHWFVATADTLFELR